MLWYRIEFDSARQSTYVQAENKRKANQLFKKVSVKLNESTPSSMHAIKTHHTTSDIESKLKNPTPPFRALKQSSREVVLLECSGGPDKSISETRMVV